MCLYPVLGRNKKYEPNKKNAGKVPAFFDDRVLHVPRACANCIECKKAKARDWQLRLTEEIKAQTNGKFITLTFSNESIKKIYEQKGLDKWPNINTLKGYDLDNEIAKRAIHWFRERWRKEFKEPIRHWLTTELGHNGTENIHLHGIIWTDRDFKTIARKWEYGYIWPRPEDKKRIRKNYVNEKTINYIMKYVSKMDFDHKEYKPKVFTSPGIGSEYIYSFNSKNNKFNGINTDEGYRLRSGRKVNMPIYWRNKLYTDEEREILWLQKLDKQKRYVMGEEINVSNGMNIYWDTLEYYREINNRMGYGTNEKEWDRIEYENKIRDIKIKTRISKARRPN